MSKRLDRGISTEVNSATLPIAAQTLQTNLGLYRQTYDEYWARWHADRKTDSWADTDDASFRQVTEQRLEHLSQLAGYTIQKSWNQLSPFARRVLDVAAAHQLSLSMAFDGSKNSLAAEDLLASWYEKGSIPTEADYLYQKISTDGYSWPVNKSTFTKESSLSLYHFQSMVASIYGGEWSTGVEGMGTKVFALQRGLSQLTPVILPELLQHIPKGYTINRSAVSDYFTQVMATSRMGMIGHDGLSLTLNPHIEKPYSNRKREAELRKQLDAAPVIAQAMVKAVPDLIVVTMYGPLTRRDKRYVMFHPHQGLQLGAFFRKDDHAQVDKAIEVANDVGEQHGVKIKAGTSHGGVFGGSFSGWSFCNPRYLQDIVARLAGKNRSLDLDLDNLGEQILQVADGQPLVINGKPAYYQLRAKLEVLRRLWLTPIFKRVQTLHRHMAAGYPHPLEFKESK